MEKQAKFIDLKNALEYFNNLPNESSPEGFYALRGSIKGVILVTNLRMSFVYNSDEDKIECEQIIYSFIESIKFKIYQDKTQIDVDYAYTTLRLTILDNYDANKIKSILTKVLPEKVNVIESIPNINEKSKRATTLLNLETSKKTKSLIGLEEFSLKQKKKFILFTKLFIFFIVLLIIYICIPKNMKYFVKNIFTTESKIGYIMSYAKNFIEIQQCYKNEAKMGGFIKEDILITKEYPKNFTEFLKTNLKSNINKDVSRDPWGRFYYLETSPYYFKIISCGPDKMKNTIDDIVTKFPNKIQ